jgi:RNA polymerase nonessential primary-like sigma factor
MSVFSLFSLPWARHGNATSGALLRVAVPWYLAVMPPSRRNHTARVEYTGEAAHRMDSLVASCRTLQEGSAAHTAAEHALAALVEPLLQPIARAFARRASYPVADLLQEGRLVALKAWRGFKPFAKKDRTLYPAYVGRLARQAMRKALGAAGPIHVTDHARKTLKLARERAAATGASEEQVLDLMSRRGDEVALALVAVAGRRYVSEEAALNVADERLEHLERQAVVESALSALMRLPRLHRVVLTALCGLGRQELGPAGLSKELRLSVQEVRRLEAEAVFAVRALLEGGAPVLLSPPRVPRLRRASSSPRPLPLF